MTKRIVTSKHIYIPQPYLHLTCLPNKIIFSSLPSVVLIYIIITLIITSRFKPNTIISSSMNNQPRIPLHVSSQIQRSQPPSTSISVETVEHSVQNLIKSWYRRKKWMHLCNPILVLDPNRKSWRNHLIKFLESTPVHVFAISLLLLDLILTILQLSSSLLSCTPEEDNKIEKVWYHWAGISILSLLSAKSAALVVGLGSSFFKRPGYVVDGAVAIGALFLEAFLERKGGGLLVVVSLWRVVRLVESAFELSDEAIEAQIEGIVSQFEALTKENTRLLKTIAEKDDMIEKLQEIIQKLEKELDQNRVHINALLCDQ